MFSPRDNDSVRSRKQPGPAGGGWTRAKAAKPANSSGTETLHSRAPAGRELPPRLQQVLNLLLEGKSMKEIATRLKIARNTVHVYATEVYRRFGVHGHVEPLAHFLRRERRRTKTRPTRSGAD